MCVGGGGLRENIYETLILLKRTRNNFLTTKTLLVYNIIWLTLSHLQPDIYIFVI